jgi:diguanylate cyclase (GGDEF)-like protein
VTTPGQGLILVADDDDDIVSFVQVNLRLEGFEVATASDGEQALEAAIELVPDLIILDIMMPKLDGLEVCRRLRSESRTKNISIIMLTARSLTAEKVVGLTAGADDYIIKPFDPLELVARVKSALRRARDMRAVSPLTQLPGNVQVQEEIADRVGSGAPFALLYVDLDNFKAFNDFYGFLRGDEAIKSLAQCVTQVVQRYPGYESFVGHVGGDDFIAIVEPTAAESVAKEVIALWDEQAPSLYEQEDVARGHIEVLDRRKRPHRFGLLTVSVGIVSTAQRPIQSHWEASEVATEMKQFAKRQEGSAYAIDRRRGGPTGV